MLLFMSGDFISKCSLQSRINYVSLKQFANYDFNKAKKGFVFKTFFIKKKYKVARGTGTKHFVPPTIRSEPQLLANN